MPGILSPYVNQVNPYLRKTGGDLLFRDPIEGKEAATKDYVDSKAGTLVTGACAIGNWLGCPFTNGGVSDTFAIVGNDAKAVIHPVYVGRQMSFDRIGASWAYTSSPGTPAQPKLLVYELDPTTLFPTEQLYREELGTAITNIAQRWYFNSMSLTVTGDTWLGVGWEYDIVASLGEIITALRMRIATIDTPNYATGAAPMAPYGVKNDAASGSAPAFNPVCMLVARYENAGIPTSGPAVSDFAIDPDLESGQHTGGDSGVFLRRSA